MKSEVIGTVVEACGSYEFECHEEDIYPVVSEVAAERGKKRMTRKHALKK